MNLRAFALTDGAAGNAKQAAALAQLLGLNAEHITLRLNGLDQWLAPRFKSASLHTKIGTSQTLASWLQAAQPELVIGCGRAAAAALRAIKCAKHSCKTVQILAPECSPNYFDWVICPGHDRVRGANVLTCLGAVHTIESLLSSRSNQTNALLLLLGQPSANVPWTLTQLRTLLTELSAWPGQIWISSSRRSSFDLPTLIAESALRHHPNIEIYQAGTAMENPYLLWLLSAQQIIVTPDSVNMATEAMATRAHVNVPWQSVALGKIARFLHANTARLSPLYIDDTSGNRAQPQPIADCQALAQVLKGKLGLLAQSLR